MSFKSINYLLFKKKKKENSSDFIQEFNPFLTMRYFSFYDKDYVEYANNYINPFLKLFSTREDQFNFLDNIIPRSPTKKINYVKFIKSSVETETIPEFYSKKEIDNLRKIHSYLHE